MASRPSARQPGTGGIPSGVRHMSPGVPSTGHPPFRVCDLGAIPPGTYRGKHKGLWVHLDIRRPRHGDHKGTTFVYAASRVTGRWGYAGKKGPKMRNYVGHYTEAVHSICADPLGAARAFGAHTGHCSGCGKDLERGSICEPCRIRLANVLRSQKLTR